MEISVLTEEGIEGCPDTAWLRGIMEQVLTLQGIADRSEVSLVITGQERIRELNKAYRGLDAPTDVLSFYMTGPQEGGGDVTPFVAAPDSVLHLGEVIISCPQAALQAKEQGHPVKKEIAVLIIHGVLHLLGYDHAEPDQAAGMKAREQAILQEVQVKYDLT